MSTRKLSLKVIERINISNICPPKDNIERLITRKSILEKVDFTPEESEKINLKLEGNKYTWKEDTPSEKKIEFSEVEMSYLKSCITELSNKKELHADMISLYDKIT